jgi:aminopeptidase N
MTIMHTIPAITRSIVLCTFLINLLTACNGNTISTPLNAEEFVVEQVPALNPQHVPAVTLPFETKSAVLEACDASVQSTAMQIQSIPDWDVLNLEACYELTLDLTNSSPTYEGSARVTFTNLKGVPLTDLVFRTYPNAEQIYGGELSITSAHVDGIDVDPEEFLSDRTAVRISFANDLNPGETAVIELDFRGKTPTNLSGNERIYGIFNYASQEKVLALANWYPILAVWRGGAWQAMPVLGIGDAVVSETALYSVRVTASNEWQVVSTGSEVQRTSKNGATLYAITSGPARDFIVLASPNFTRRTIEKDGVQIYHWGLPGGKDRWEEALNAARDALKMFNDRFGKYPYTELDVIAIPLELASGVEYPGVILVNEQLYLPDEERPFFLGVVVAHEVAHQWWYGVVGNDVIENPWQDEALATFSSLLYQEFHQPDYYAGTIRFYKSRVDEVKQRAGSTQINQPVNAFLDHPQDYSPIIYTKGALVFLEIERQLGEKAFFQALQAYYADNRYQLPEPKILLDEFEKACQCRLDDLYAREGLR